MRRLIYIIIITLIKIMIIIKKDSRIIMKNIRNYVRYSVRKLLKIILILIQVIKKLIKAIEKFLKDCGLF